MAAAENTLKKAPATERIRRAARDLFYRDGIRAVGVEAIVTEAGVTKPSLYRAYPSKDELAAAYLRDWDALFWQRFDEGKARYPRDPRAQLCHYLRGLAERATVDGYRGCGLTNAAVEYPETKHPARRVAKDAKRALRHRLREMAAAMGAADPGALGDGLLLLIEGTFASGQIFGKRGPAQNLVAAAEALIDASLPHR
jgi:AcrR family transcriptional regulator